ncbi:MAG: hypothetical protein U5K28_00500 [Halobacteriales archaeon]|nr:hypothetical protein [Halobacteriales archaeon]
MGTFATDVQERLRDALAERRNGEWATETTIAGTPVDVLGQGERTVAVELEWRRADPVNNTAKLFRHLAEETLDGEILVLQLFSRYYDLQSGGVSSKRENAEFVGRVATDALAGFDYRPLTLDIDPPKRGGDRPEGWRTAVARAATQIADA